MSRPNRCPNNGVPKRWKSKPGGNSSSTAGFSSSAVAVGVRAAIELTVVGAGPIRGRPCRVG
jgi:hypothetical protein